MIKEADIKFPDIPFRKTAVLIVIGLVIYFGYLYLVGFDKVKDILLIANYWYLGLAMLVALTGNLFHTAGWWLYLRDKGYKISLFKAYQMYLASIFFVNLLPTMAVSGEVSKIYFIQKIDPDSRFDKTLSTCVISRVLEIFPIAVGAAAGALYLALFYHLGRLEAAFCLFIAVALAALAVVCFVVAMNNVLLRQLAGAGLRLLGRLLKKDMSGNAAHVDVILTQFDESLKEIMKKRLLVAASLALIFIAWCFDVSIAYIAFLAIGHPVSPALVITVYSVMVILQMLPIFLPGGLGIVDFIMTNLYANVGMSQETAAGATILVRFVTLWFLTTVGGLMTLYLAKAHGENDNK